MPFCPLCGAEYRPGFKECSDCALALVDERPYTPALSRGARRDLDARAAAIAEACLHAEGDHLQPRRRSRWRALRWLALLVACAGLLGWAGLAGLRWSFRDLDWDCNQYPPFATFARFFPSAPPGILDLAATGRMWIGGANV